jgi:C-terminal binding protein
VEKALGVERVRTIEELFTMSNIVSLHCPLTNRTRNLVSTPLLSLMPKGSLLITTSRGAVCDLDALEKALRDGSLGGAALDVVPGEPISTDPNEVHPVCSLSGFRHPS